MKQFVSEGGFILGQTAWEEGVPWLRPDATQYIHDHLHYGARAFEWGMGGSTVWMARRGYKVISMELDHAWFEKVDAFLALNYLTEDVSVYCHATQKTYADYILNYPDMMFDFVLIDGRNRCRCLGNALSKVKIGGMLCLDNSERQEYAKAVALMDTWDGYEWGDEGWTTAVWHRSEYSIVDRVEFPNEDA